MRGVRIQPDKKAGARPAFQLSDNGLNAYVVERGLTAINVAGTMVPLPL
jgi:hypothetical protein